METKRDLIRSLTLSRFRDEMNSQNQYDQEWFYSHWDHSPYIQDLDSKTMTDYDCYLMDTYVDMALRIIAKDTQTQTTPLFDSGHNLGPLYSEPLYLLYKTIFDTSTGALLDNKSVYVEKKLTDTIEYVEKEEEEELSWGTASSVLHPWAQYEGTELLQEELPTKPKLTRQNGFINN